jgi:hypothetical protein
LLGDDGAAIPFLRYLPEHLSPLGVRVEAVLHERLAEAPSFVAFEGYDTVTVPADVMRSHGVDRAALSNPGRMLQSKVPVGRSGSPARQASAFGNGRGHPSKSSIEIRRSLSAFEFSMLRQAMIHRRSAIAPVIGHMKTDGRLGRSPLKGALGDALHAVMCGAGHNLQLIMAKLWLLCSRFGLTSPALLATLSPSLATTQLMQV